MTFTVQQFQDLVRLLEERPQWRAELRRLVLPDEVLALPQIVSDLVAKLAALTDRVGQLAEAQQRTEGRLAVLTERVDQLTVRLDRLTERVERLAEAQQHTEAQLATLAKRMDQLVEIQGRMQVDVSEIKGWSLEDRCKEYAQAYFDDLMRRIRVIPREDFAAQLEDAFERGQLSPEERRDAIRLDLLLRGQRVPDRADAYLAVEISWMIAPDDVLRAAQRAALFGRLNPIVIPAVAGRGVTPEAMQKANALGVKVVLDGQPFGQ